MAATKTERVLEGVRVSITSRMACMSREEARERIAAAGGVYQLTAREDTDLLVVGQGGPALGDDGKLTRSLMRAKALQADGLPIHILSEGEFLERIGLEQRREDFHRLYTSQQLQRILGVSPRDIRTWVRGELIQPVRVVNRLCFFDFQQVATARALSRLHAEGVGVQRIRKSLQALERWLPGSDAALAQLESLEDGGPLLVRTREGRLAEASGQLRMEFEPGRDEPDTTLPRVTNHWGLLEGGLTEAEALFDQGMQAEAEGDLDGAVEAYLGALDLDGPDAEIAFNLGNTLYALDRPEEAVERFQEATRLDSSYVEAWNNTGNVLSQLGRGEEAVSAYRRAISLAPDYADAHFNLAETLAAMGSIQEARRHWRAYLLQDPHSPTAREVRARLDERP